MASAASVPCALNQAAQSCWAANTGVQAGTGSTEAQIEAGAPGFTHVTGAVTATSGQTINHEWISGCVAIDGNNVTIENTLITGNGMTCHGAGSATSPGLINTGSGGSAPTGTLIKYTTVDDTANGGGDVGEVGSDNITCDHCNIFGANEDMTIFANDTVRDSYLHDLATNSGSTHQNSILGYGPEDNNTITHNWIDTGPADHSSCPICVTAAVSLQTNAGGASQTGNKNMVENNFIWAQTSANFEFECGSDGVPSTNNIVQGNALDPNSGKDGATGYETNSHNGPSGSGFGSDGNIWSGNYNSENPSQAASAPGGC